MEGDVVKGGRDVVEVSDVPRAQQSVGARLVSVVRCRWAGERESQRTSGGDAQQAGKGATKHGVPFRGLGDAWDGEHRGQDHRDEREDP